MTMIARFRFSNQKHDAAVLILGFALANAAAAAGLSEVKQTVFGMDCAPCAHGVEKGLSKIDGVKDVSVSLNDGYALVRLEPDNAVTLEQIRLVIRENGFTPKDAAVVVSGTLTRADDQLVLVGGANTSRQFSLVASPDAQSAWRQLQALPQSAMVEIEARAGESDTTRLSVLTVKRP
jgi:copper chaperone CopZ